MKKTTFTSDEQGRSIRNWREIIYSVSAICLLFYLPFGAIQAQNQCVMSCTSTQVSVDENCEAVITYDMVSTPSPQCSGSFLVEVLDDDGHLLPTSPMVNHEHIDQSFTVRVIDIASGNFCWSTIHVEDKMPPQIVCENDTIACWDMIEHEIPEVFDNCSDPDEIDITLLNENIVSLSCDPDFIKRVDRTYIATDASGNQSSECTKSYFLERIDFDSIQYPPSFKQADNTQLACDDDFPVDGNGNPHPSVTGVPSINGIDLYPISGDYCNILVTYHDVEFPVINCKQKIQRTWTVREWWCSDEIVNVGVQVIEITDEEGPDIVCPNDITVTTSTQSCSAGVYLQPAIVSDNCNEVDRVDITYPGGFLGGSNGGFISLPLGDNVVTYTAYDECLNSSSCSINVTVEDQTPPVAVCKTVTAVSLSSNGLAKVFPESFDNGSYDECGIDSMLVARMNESCGYDTEFRDYVEFSCCDIPNNLIQVILRVFDTSGNTNECMVEVEVQDKLPASITCPPDITVSCQFPFDQNDLSIFGTVVPINDLAVLQDPNLDPRESIVLNDPDNIPLDQQPFDWGVDGFAYDNCEVTVEETEEFDIDQCGTGNITRTFTADGPGGPSTSCEQHITIENYMPFTEDQIEWPDNVVIYTDATGVCEPEDLDPDITGRPIVDDGFCDLVGINDPTDHVFTRFSPSTDSSCFKILRKWKVIDWCQFENGVYEIWEHTQTIKIMNTTGPEFTTDCEDIVECSFDDQCSATFIELVQEAVDDCTPEDELVWSYSIDAFNTGSFEYTQSYNPYADPDNAPNEASGTYPIGIHRIVWTVEDACGNASTCEQIFEIRNCKPPTPVCHHGLAFELSSVDLSGDGEPDWAEGELNAEKFDAGSHHICGYDVSLSYSPDPADTLKYFDCDSVGQRIVEIWMTDENGNQANCITYVIVQDNKEVCPNTGTVGGSISGLIANVDDQGVEDVTLNLQGDQLATSFTDEHGFFAFTGVPLGQNYQLVPEKNDDYRNGVSTYDIALIQRHILGISQLTDPYSQIAADVNRDGEISVLDIAELRRLILGTRDEFDNNDSWRFIKANYQFTTGNALQENFDEVVDVYDLDEQLRRTGFVGVKVGDVNHNAVPNSAQADGRSMEEPLAFYLNERKFERGEMIAVPFTAADFESILGFQGTLMFDNDVLEIVDIKAGRLDIDESNFGFASTDEGMLTVSWSDPFLESFANGEVLFEITFSTRESGHLSNHISMGSAITGAEIYRDGKVSPLELKFEEVETGDGYVLFQNRPNPFRDETVIGFRLPEPQNATLSIYDVTGKLIHEVSDYFFEGYNEIRLNRNSLNASGVLYYQLDAEGFNASRKMIIVD